jgi:type II secretory ATPase GspE/PulE/Tfp pilus assembly ATPase PilB-like protein/CheY-like chemotaxis protein
MKDLDKTLVEAPAPGRVTHWLVGVAQRAGLANADSLSMPAGLAPAEAWEQVTSTCGVTEEELTRHIARVTRHEVADLTTAEPRVMKLLTESVARQYLVAPLREDYRRLVVAVHNPTDLRVEQAVAFASGRTPVLEIASPREIEQMIDDGYSSDWGVEHLLDSVDGGDGGEIQVIDGPEVVQISEEDLAKGPVVRLTDLILKEAIEGGASDIHIQPSDTGGSVRYRVDGVLRHYMHLPTSALVRVVSRIKILGGMDITDHMRPQDGRARVGWKGRVCDLRISTVPTRNAEKAVIRILGASGPNRLEEMGLPTHDLDTLRRLLQQRQGIVVVTGPTGSGKTTTMYSALREFHADQVNIMTVEDPIEYELPGMTQMQVENRQGMTFGKALRAILRQDPDVIFVGEIRDAETADIAVQASRTGHLVLATLHTNDAIGTIARFGDLDLDGAAIVDTLRGVVAQRLLRRVCPKCATPATDPLTTDEDRLAREYGVRPAVRPKGCHNCGQSGYQGRIPVTEMFTMTPKLADLIARRASPDELLRAARADGMQTLRECALQRVRDGETTLDEVQRVIGFDEESSTDRAAAMGGASAAQTARPAAPPQRAEEESEDEPSRILVVDDDRTTRTIARGLLASSGYRVTEAENGPAALDLLSVNHYALVVLDLEMPGMTGRDVLGKVRTNVHTAAIPIIVLTGNEDPETEIELMDLGADDYVRKPIDPPRFVTRVRATLRRSSMG